MHSSSTWALAMMSTFRSVMGDFKLEDMQNGNFLLASVSFLFLVIVGAILLMNLFIAVVSEVFSKELAVAHERWNDTLNDQMANAIFCRLTGRIQAAEQPRIAEVVARAVRRQIARAYGALEVRGAPL